MSDDVVKEGNVNDLVKNRQLRQGVFVVGAFVLGAFVLVQLTSDGKASKEKIVSEDLTTTVQRKPGDKDSFKIISSQVNEMLGKVDKFEAATDRMNEFLDKNENTDALGDLQSALTAVQNDNEELRDELTRIRREGLNSDRRDPFGNNQSTSASRNSGNENGSGAIPARPNNANDIFAPRGRTAPGGRSQPVIAGAPAAPETRTQRVLQLYQPTEGEDEVHLNREAELYGEQTKATKPEVYDTENYVPPNAYVSAKLVVSVDAGIGETSASDPKAAQFIITGPAKHVQSGQKIEMTDLEGCLVNGSAEGNLSSERVYINLHAMSCPMGDGKVSVSKVEGYATHLGKNGIRGTVVSREGDLVTKAIIAGTLEGLGRTASNQTNGGIGIGSGGGLIGDRPNATEIVTGSLGSGLASGANTYSQYLLDRARAYEPVVSLPTGIDVELVFISGTLVRPLTEGEGG